MQRIHRALAVAVMLSALAAQPLRASEFFRSSGYGPVSRAMGGTALAHDIGPSALISNPATIGLGPAGTRLESAFDIFIAGSVIGNRDTGESVTTTKNGWQSFYVIPGFGLTHRAGRFTFGFYSGGESGAGAEFGDDTFLSRTPSGVDTGLENSSRFSVVRSPLAVSARYRDVLAPGDTLHIAAAAELIYMGIDMQLLSADSQFQDLAAVAGGGAGHIRAEDSGEFESGLEGYGVGGRLGFVYGFGPKTHLGVAYNFETKVEDLDGKATLTAVSAAGAQTPISGRLKVKDLQLPPSLAVGVGHRPHKDLLIAADVVRYFNSRTYDEINLSFVADGGGTADLSIPQNARDYTVLRGGAAWTLSSLGLPAVTAMVGGSVSDAGLPADRLLAVIAVTPRHTASAGVAVKFSEALRGSFAYTHAFEKSYLNPGPPNAPAGEPRETGRRDNVFAFGVDLRF